MFLFFLVLIPIGLRHKIRMLKKNEGYLIGNWFFEPNIAFINFHQIRRHYFSEFLSYYFFNSAHNDRAELHGREFDQRLLKQVYTTGDSINYCCNIRRPCQLQRLVMLLLFLLGMTKASSQNHCLC
jgi:hypothetical protein